jgi:translocation and assembly module TamA
VAKALVNRAGRLWAVCGLLLPWVSQAQQQAEVVVQAPQASAASRGAASTATNPAVRRAPPIWQVDIEAPGDLADLLDKYLDLSRFEAQVAAQSVEPSLPAGDATPDAQANAQSLADRTISRSELRRLVAAAPAQARALLEAEGHFNADVQVSMGPEVPGEPQRITIKVNPGPKARIDKLQMVFEGMLDERIAKDDAPALSLQEALMLDWALPVGESFRQAAWSSAKSAALTQLRANGYPAAAWSGTAATVDAPTNAVKLYLVADSGPAFQFGELQIEGLKHQPESAIRNLQPYRLGAPYRERSLLDFQERVQKLNLFESVFINLDDDPAQAQAAPVRVQVRELPLRQATFGIGVSSDTGPRVSVEHLHRLLGGWPLQARSKVQLGRDESILQSDVASHPQEGGKRWLGALQFARELGSDQAVTLSGRVRFGVSDEGLRMERTRYAEFQRATVQAADGVTVSQASAFTAMQQWVWKGVDSIVLPTRGLTANVALGGGRSFATLAQSGWFARGYGRLTWYRPLPWRWYASTRLEVGQVLAADSVSVPDTLLFRAGGDDSVRGYAYRSLGVVTDGTTLGTRSLLTSSVELAHPLIDRIPNLWGAVFVDVGDAAPRLGDLSPKLGYGAGVRWRSPVGPLRLDVAYGQQVSQYRLHFSVGIAL